MTMARLRTSLLLSTLSCLAILISACGTTAPKKPALAAEPTIHVKFGSTSPTDSLGGASALYFAQQLRKDSHGHIQVTVYPNAELGEASVINTGLQTGTIQFTSNDILDTYVPAVDVLNTAYLFPSQSVADAVLNSPQVYKLIWNRLESHGIKVLAVWPSGFTDIFATKPITTPADLRGVKIRTFVPTVETPEYSAVGADATAVAYNEVFTALSSHLIQAVTDPSDLVVPLKWQQAAPYVSVIGMAFVTVPLLVSQSFWNSLDKLQQSQVSEAAASSLKYVENQVPKYNDSALASLKSESGVHVLYPNISAFRSAFAKAYPTINRTFPGVLTTLRALVAKQTS